MPTLQSSLSHIQTCTVHVQTCRFGNCDSGKPGKKIATHVRVYVHVSQQLHMLYVHTLYVRIMYQMFYENVSILYNDSVISKSILQKDF